MNIDLLLYKKFLDKDMNDYDFSQINDKEFEILSCDLLSKLYDTRVERFKAGRDGGVDGRFFINNKDECIIQCKHYLGSGYKKMIYDLKNSELAKVEKLAPSNYIFLTSLKLSVSQKKEIQEIFSPFIRNENDVFGNEDLNNLLKTYPEVEENHYKLWISSSTVLQRIFHNGIRGRSEFELKNIQEENTKYVITDSHKKSLEQLKENNVIIICGEAGIGKTTLSNNLMLFYAAKEYEFIMVEESIKEAEELFSPSKKQIFYFDDFLGHNYLEAIEGKKDSHIVRFIQRVKKDKNKKFILNSRTNILNQGLALSDSFNYYNIQKNEFLIEIKNLTELDKAKILYNHLWFSDLPTKYRDEIYKNKKYKEIINHKKFNPRIIAFITNNDNIHNISVDKYWTYIVDTLNNPEFLWERPLMVESDESIRDMVLLTVFNGGTILEEDLKYSFEDIKKNYSASIINKGFKRTAKITTKSFLNRNLLGRSEGMSYTLFNPSISDFVISNFSSEKKKLISIFLCLNTVKSLRVLEDLKRNNKLEKKNASDLENILFDDAFSVNKSMDYKLYISSIVSLKDIQAVGKQKIVNLLLEIIEHPKKIKECYSFIFLLVLYSSDILDELILDFSFLEKALGTDLSNSDIQEFIWFIESLHIEPAEFPFLIDFLEKNLKNILERDLSDELEILDLTDYVEFFEDEPMEVFEDDIKQEIISIGVKKLNDLSPDLANYLDVDISMIVEELDINSAVENHIDTLENSKSDDEKNIFLEDIISDVDDLFDRS